MPRTVATAAAAVPCRAPLRRGYRSRARSSCGRRGGRAVVGLPSTPPRQPEGGRLSSLCCRVKTADDPAGRVQPLLSGAKCSSVRLVICYRDVSKLCSPRLGGLARRMGSAKRRERERERETPASSATSNCGFCALAVYSD